MNLYHFRTYSISHVKSEHFNGTTNRYGLSEEFYKSDWKDFLAKIGGTMGLFIGCSIMSISQIVLYMTMVICGRAKKSRRNRNYQEVMIIPHHDNP
uniref:Uncharacterized protein n=1 Tax=Acrobeloides nanus TaxID=290746 RepID=A0A914CWC1_9BILA